MAAVVAASTAAAMVAWCAAWTAAWFAAAPGGGHRLRAIGPVALEEQIRCLRSEDFKEAGLAMAEGRSPQWQGR